MSEQNNQRGSMPLVTGDLEERLAQARQSAKEWRERLGVTGEATPEDTARLVAEAVPDARIERAEGRPGSFIVGATPPILWMPLGLETEEEVRSLAWFVGHMLHVPPIRFTDEPGRSAVDKAKAYSKAIQVPNQIAYEFADTWIYGLPNTIHPASDPGALELLALIGLDRFPELAEARQMAQERPEAMAVQVDGITQPYVMFLKGLVVLCYVDPALRPTRS